MVVDLRPHQHTKCLLVSFRAPGVPHPGPLEGAKKNGNAGTWCLVLGPAGAQLRVSSPQSTRHCLRRFGREKVDYNPRKKRCVEKRRSGKCAWGGHKTWPPYLCQPPAPPRSRWCCTRVCGQHPWVHKAGLGRPPRRRVGAAPGAALKRKGPVALGPGYHM